MEIDLKDISFVNYRGKSGKCFTLMKHEPTGLRLAFRTDAVYQRGRKEAISELATLVNAAQGESHV